MPDFRVRRMIATPIVDKVLSYQKPFEASRLTHEEQGILNFKLLQNICKDLTERRH